MYYNIYACKKKLNIRYDILLCKTLSDYKIVFNIYKYTQLKRN